MATLLTPDSPTGPTVFTEGRCVCGHVVTTRTLKALRESQADHRLYTLTVKGLLPPIDDDPLMDSRGCVCQ